MATKRKNRHPRKKTLRGGNSDFNVPIRSFYPQNTFEHDPSRMTGGAKRKNHSRKYLKRTRGGDGFFSNFGTFTGQTNISQHVTGSFPQNNFVNQNYKV